MRWFLFLQFQDMAGRGVPANCRSYGPLYQGYRLPILDCSRGMNEEIAYDNIAFLCVQAANSK